MQYESVKVNVPYLQKYCMPQVFQERFVMQTSLQLSWSVYLTANVAYSFDPLLMTLSGLFGNDTCTCNVFGWEYIVPIFTCCWLTFCCNPICVGRK